MRYLQSLFVSSLLAASALAQDYARVAFTSVPGVAVAGSTYNVTWTGGSGQTVSLLLRRGNSINTRLISILADRVAGYSYAWTVSTSLESGIDYTLQITQGQSDINYSGTFSIVGGTGTLSISAPGITLPPQASNATIPANATVVTISGSTVNLNATSNAATGSLTNATATNATAMSGNATTPASSPASRTSSSSAAVAAASSSSSAMVTSRASSSAAATGSGQTNFPTATNGPGLVNLPQLGGSVALVMAVIGAVMGLN